MARVKVGGGAPVHAPEAPKPSAQERTIPLPFEGEKKPNALEWPVALECPHCGTRQLSKACQDIPLANGGGKVCIKCNSALSRLNRASPPEGAAAPPPPVEPDPEREAIQAEAREAEKPRAAIPPPPPPAAPPAEIASALGGSFFGNPSMVTQTPKPADAKPPTPAQIAKSAIEAARADVILDAGELGQEGDEVVATHPEEMYGKQGTFSSYRVGPFVLKTKLRGGETRTAVMRKLLAELRELANEEREKAHAEFCSHFMNKIAGK